jgi:hypothetical protein
MTDHVSVIIRAVSERTLNLCYALATSELPSHSAVTVISEFPFEKTLRQCYEAGLRANRQWTVTVDADVILFPGTLHRLVQLASLMPKTHVQLEGRVFDKITGMYRRAGLRIYRTKLLEKAVDLIPEDGKEIRPEYSTLQALRKMGHGSRYVSEVLALHDFEQSYGDLYRKSFVHARKFTSLVPSMLERCRLLMEEDCDYLVIIKGLCDGLTSLDHISIDKSLFSQRSQNAIQELGLLEKDPISVEAFIPPLVGYIAEAMKGTKADYFEIYDEEPSGERRRRLKLLEAVRRRMDEKGVWRGSVASVGAALVKIGRRLDMGWRDKRPDDDV